MPMLERLPGLYEFSIEERPGSPIMITLYLIRGKAGERSLLVDSGYGTPHALQQLL